MKVKVLIEQLQKLDPELEVFNWNDGISEDSYTPIESVEVGPPTMYPQTEGFLYSPTHSPKEDAVLLN